MQLEEFQRFPDKYKQLNRFCSVRNGIEAALDTQIHKY